MIVLKFGGTSVQDAFWMDKAIDITEKRINQAPLLIASAMTRITDKLVAVSAAASEGLHEEALKLYGEIKDQHFKTAAEFISGKNLEEAEKKLEELFDELHSLIKGVLLLKECTAASHDAMLSFGERLSTLLLYYRCRERGIKAELLDSRDFIKTDNNFNNAYPDFKKTNAAAAAGIKPVPGKILIAQGFIGSTDSGVTSTLGRGGSDYSATIFGAALKASEVEIWTDVNGIMTTDPRIVPEAKTIETISYAEAAELAYFGAKVVHPSTIQPAVDLGIPVMVKNTRDPEGNFTAIIPEAKAHGARAIAGKKNITLINVTSSRMLNAYGFLNRIFSIFEKHKTSVDLIATSEVSVSMTIDKTSSLKEILEDLNQLGRVETESSLAIVCIVGQNIWQNPDIISRVFKALTGSTVKLISLGSSDTNLSVVLPEKDLNNAIKKLHAEFF